MLEVRENPALLQEPPLRLLAEQAVLDELDGDALLEVTVGALGEADDPHASFAELADDAIGADRPARQAACRRTTVRIVGIDDERRGPLGGRDGEERPRRAVGREKLLDDLSEPGVAGARFVER